MQFQVYEPISAAGSPAHMTTHLVVFPSSSCGLYNIELFQMLE